MNLIIFFIVAKIVLGVRLTTKNITSFLKNNLTFIGSKKVEYFKNRLKEEDLDLNTEDSNLDEEDLKNIEGVYGNESKKAFESLEFENDENPLGPDHFRELLKTKNEKFDKQMNELFDLSNLPKEEGKSIDWDDLEKKISENKVKEGLNIDEMKSLVHSIYKQKGLLNERFKTLEVSGLKLKWRQSLNNIEIWIELEPETKKGDYDVTFLPSTLTIRKNNHVIFEKTLFGKVDCDGCFWTMYKNPTSGTKYLNVSLTKRPPKFNNMWDQLLI